MASTAPSTETPAEPPRERKKVTVAVAEPTLRMPTVFCAASTRFCISAPTPVPIIARNTPIQARLVVWSTVLSSDSPVSSTSEPATRKGLVRPVRDTIRPVTVEEVTRPSTIGRVSNPASVGEKPRAIWKYCTRNTAPPNMAVPTLSEPTTARVKVRSRNRCSGTTGSATRVSTNRASPSSATAPPTRAAVVGEIHAKSWPARENQTSSSATPDTSSSAPSQSIVTGRRSTGSRRVRPSTTKASTAMGTHTQNDQRQPSGESTISPPISGPDVVATAKVAPM